MLLSSRSGPKVGLETGEVAVAPISSVGASE